MITKISDAVPTSNDLLRRLIENDVPAAPNYQIIVAMFCTSSAL